MLATMSDTSGRRFLACHLPHPFPSEDDIAWNVYLKEGHLDKADDVSPGDVVLFFVTATDHPKCRKKVDGAWQEVRLTHGGGVQYIGYVAVGNEIPRKREDPPQYDYEGDGDIEADTWTHEIVCEKQDRTRVVDLATLKARLGFSKSPYLWHGLFEIEDVEAFDKLVEELTA